MMGYTAAFGAAMYGGGAARGTSIAGNRVQMLRWRVGINDLSSAASAGRASRRGPGLCSAPSCRVC